MTAANWAFWRRVLVTVEIDSSGDRLRNMAQLDRHDWLSEKLAQRYRPDVDVCVHGSNAFNSDKYACVPPIHSVLRSSYRFHLTLYSHIDSLCVTLQNRRCTHPPQCCFLSSRLIVMSLVISTPSFSYVTFLQILCFCPLYAASDTPEAKHALKHWRCISSLFCPCT